MFTTTGSASADCGRSVPSGRAARPGRPPADGACTGDLPFLFVISLVVVAVIGSCMQDTVTDDADIAAIRTSATDCLRAAEGGGAAAVRVRLVTPTVGYAVLDAPVSGPAEGPATVLLFEKSGGQWSPIHASRPIGR